MTNLISNLLLIFSLLLVSTLLPTSTIAFTKHEPTHGKTIIAYYASWQWYDRDGLAKPSNLDHTKVTRYNFAFFQINESGSIWGTDEWADANLLYGTFDWNYVPGAGNEYCSWDKESGPPTCAGHHYESGLIYQAHQAGVEVYPSIGGWTLSDPFPALAANPEARLNFAANCVKLIEAYDFDGIDIDWEYPGYAAHSGTPEDTVNYNLFLQDIRDALDELGARTGRFYGLTAALPCGPDLISNIQIDVVSGILTELNLMTYDFHGSWNPKTGANAPLYDMDGSPDFSVHGCVENWKAGGGDPDQINIGLPFYGRSFAGPGLTGWGQTHSGYADTITFADDEGSPQYFNIVNKLDWFTTVRDPQTKTQYAYNNECLVSYDDERAICDKTQYAMDNNLNGYIIWEISGDILPDLSTPLLDATNNRLNNPSLRCEEDQEIISQDVPLANQQWYPIESLKHCVNDGKQQEHFIAHDLIFGSAFLCCQAKYKLSNPDCESQSLDYVPEVEAVEETVVIPDVYQETDPNNMNAYALPEVEVDVVTVGTPQPTSKPTSSTSASPENIQVVAEEDVDVVTESLPAVVDTGDQNAWYPYQALGYCVNDGKQSEHFIAPDHIFESALACCQAIYHYNDDCATQSLNPSTDGQWIEGISQGDQWYPHGNVCKSETPIPSWIHTLYDSQETCCEGYFGQSCASVMEEAQEMYTPTDTNTELNNSGNYLFYPHYGDGANIECRNDDNYPEWITSDMMTKSRFECCSTYYFPSWSDECNTENPYYPIFEEKTCVNDGNQEEWMGGDYVTETLWDCCQNSYQDEDSLRICTGIPRCDNCEVTEMTSAFNIDTVGL